MSAGERAGTHAYPRQLTKVKGGAFKLSATPTVFPWATLLTAAERRRVEADAVVRSASRGEFIVRAGAMVDEWLGVETGLVKLCVGNPKGRTMTHLVLGAGGWWGDTLLQRQQQRSLYDAVALRESRIIGIPRPTFVWLQQSNAGFGQFILRLMAERSAYVLALLESDRLHVPAVRVARSLAALFNPWLQLGIGLQIEISQEEIGNLTGISRQLANEAIRVLQQRGLVQVTYRGIRVTDVDGLRRFGVETVSARGKQGARNGPSHRSADRAPSVHFRVR